MNTGFMDVPRKIIRFAIQLACLISLVPLFATAYASAPSKPVQVRAAVYSQVSAEVFWSRSSDNVIVAGYELTLNGNLLGTFDALSLYRSDLAPGTRYDVSVTAIDNEGNRSPMSFVTFTTDMPDPSESDVPSSTPIAPPTGLSAKVYSSTSLEIFWDRVPSTTLFYRVYVNGSLLGTTVGVSRYIDSLQSGRQYTIDVTAVDSKERESLATSLTVTTQGNSIPAIENNFTDSRIVVYSRSSAELFWTRPQGAVVTEIFRDSQRLSETTGTSYYDDKRERGVTYRYELVARDQADSVIAREIINISDIQEPPVVQPPMVTPADPPVLENILLTRYSTTAAELFWEKAAGSVSTHVSRDGLPIGKTPGSSFFDDSRESGTGYEYELRSTDASGAVVGKATISDDNITPTQPPVIPPIATEVFSPLSNDIKPDRSIYLENGYDPVNVIRVDLRTETTDGTCTADDLSGCTLDDVLADTDKHDDLKVDIPVHFMSDDFADDGSVSNAELRLRGGGSRFAPQKSFRIKLDSKEELWRDERYLQINKHPYESDRMRNKLAMDLMSRVPHLPSLRTQFVNLWIDDGQGPADYGLFTHVERPNDDYLKARGLDKDGNLYKAEDFRFNSRDLSDVLVDEEGEPLDEDRFESSLEIEEGKDHRALVSMLTAINDPQRTFQSVLDQHFNKNNVLAWMAVNLMLKQDDSTRHNFILYNPPETETFYFIPWDYDATLSRWELPADDSYSNEDLKTRINYGYALGSANVFTEKFYRLPGIHDELLLAVDYIRQTHLDDSTIVELSEHNAQLIEPFQTRLPDREYNTQYDASPSFARNIKRNIEAVSTRFSVPIPAELFTPEMEDGNWRFSWQPAYDPTGNAVTYDLQIATGKSFAADDIVVEVIGIADSPDSVEWLVDASQLPGDDYYARLIARSTREPEKYWVPARNRLVEGDMQYYGMINFSTR